MGNRHHDKRMRARVRARMTVTGESYQRALTTLREADRSRAHDGVDLVQVDYFGVAATIAAYELVESLACVVVTSGAHRGPYPRSPLLGFGLARRGARVLH